MNLNFLSLTLVICEIDFRQIDAIFDFDSLKNHNFMIFGSLFVNFFLCRVIKTRYKKMSAYV